MKLTPLTKAQWISVARNSLFAFIATFVTIVSASGNFDGSTLVAAATAGVMAVLKIVEKALTEE